MYYSYLYHAVLNYSVDLPTPPSYTLSMLRGKKKFFVRKHISVLHNSRRFVLLKSSNRIPELPAARETNQLLCPSKTIGFSSSSFSCIYI